MQLRSSRPTWAEVSLSALRRNFRLTQEHVGPDVTVCAVVKADAYGHGSVECARALEAEGAKWLGVTSTDEGIRLREAGIAARILLMTGFWRGEEEDVVRHRLTPAVWQPESVELLHDAARALRSHAAVHIKVDTGMSRLGVPYPDAGKFCELLSKFPSLGVEGVFTHLASSEIVDDDGNSRQLERLQSVLALFHEHGITPQFIHSANSSAIATRRDAHYNFVRPGLSLYGYYLPFTSSNGHHDAVGLSVEPVLSWKTRIIGLRTVAAGSGIGYGGRFTAPTEMKVAVLPLGYADGLNRQLSSAGRVLLRGAFAPIVGRISMDLTVVDVSGVSGASIGDEVIILGGDGSQRIDAWEHADLANTVPYEILCAISARVPRRYL